MRVRVDAAGDDIGVRGVDGLVADQVLADRRDLLALDQDIGFQVRSAVTTVPPLMTLVIVVSPRSSCPALGAGPYCLTTVSDLSARSSLDFQEILDLLRWINDPLIPSADK